MEGIFEALGGDEAAVSHREERDLLPRKALELGGAVDGSEDAEIGQHAEVYGRRFLAEVGQMGYVAYCMIFA